MASLQKRKIKGKYYWYIVESKRINGKPTPIVVAYLGTVDNILSKLPSQNNQTLFCKSYDHGAAYALWQLAKKYGIIDAADSVIKERKRYGVTKGQLLMLNAIYRIVCNDETKDLSDWLSETTLPSYLGLDTENLTNNYFWNAINKFNSLRIKEIENKATHILYNALIHDKKQLEMNMGTLFNFSSIIPSSYSSNSDTPLIPVGKVKQFSVNVLAARNTSVPLASMISENNLSTTRSQARVYNAVLEVMESSMYNSKFTLILDRGSLTKDILNNISASKYNFICSIPISLHKDIASIPMDKYDVLHVNNNLIQCYRTQKIVFGKKYEMISYFNQRDKDLQIRKLNRDINERLEKLEHLRSQLFNPSNRFSNKRSIIEDSVKTIIGKTIPDGLINVTFIGKQKIKDIKYDINEQLYKELCLLFSGKKLLVTNNKSWSTEEIVGSYAMQSDIERYFRVRKRLWNFSIRDDFNWSSDKVRIHAFCCLLGLALLELLRMELHDKGYDISADHLLNVLSNVREATIFKASEGSKPDIDFRKVNGNVIRTIEEMPEFDKSIWDAVVDIISIPEEQTTDIIPPIDDLSADKESE